MLGVRANGADNLAVHSVKVHSKQENSHTAQDSLEEECNDGADSEAVKGAVQHVPNPAVVKEYKKTASITRSIQKHLVAVRTRREELKKKKKTVEAGKRGRTSQRRHGKVSAPAPIGERTARTRTATRIGPQ